VPETPSFIYISDFIRQTKVHAGEGFEPSRHFLLGILFDLKFQIVIFFLQRPQPLDCRVKPDHDNEKKTASSFAGSCFPRFVFSLI
jgi:hypothetical protein